MKKIFKTIAIMAGAMMTLLPSESKAQETKAQSKFSVSGKADFVSEYVWRGMDQNSGFSVQPSLTLSYGGLSINAWGSRSISGTAKEFDINIGYSVGGFGIMVSDYWWDGAGNPYGYYKNKHYFEGTLSYCFGERIPLAISWSTMFAGGDKDENGDLMASTYIALSYPVSLPLDITLTPALGITPWKGMYHDKFGVTDISLKANKNIRVTDKFSIPLFVQAIASPVNDNVFLVAGFSIGF